MLNFDLSTRVCGYLTVPPPDYTSFAPTDINVSLFYKLDNVTGHVLAHSEPHPLGVDCLAASLRVDDTNTATESPTFGFYLIIENLFIGKVHIYSDSDINIYSLLVKSPGFLQKAKKAGRVTCGVMGDVQARAPHGTSSLLKRSRPPASADAGGPASTVVEETRPSKRPATVSLVLHQSQGEIDCRANVFLCVIFIVFSSCFCFESESHMCFISRSAELKPQTDSCFPHSSP